MEIKNPMEESKKSSKRRINMMWSRRSGGGANEEELDEIMDGDEGIINRRLPLNSYNH